MFAPTGNVRSAVQPTAWGTPSRRPAVCATPACASSLPEVLTVVSMAVTTASYWTELPATLQYPRARARAVPETGGVIVIDVRNVQKKNWSVCIRL